METISQILNEALKAALIASLPVLLMLIGKLIQAGMDWLEAHTSTIWLRRLEEEAEIVVLGLWEVAAKAIKEACADGKISVDEAKSKLMALKPVAVDLLNKWLTSLPEKYKPLLQAKLSEAVEGALSRLKMDGRLPSNPPSAPVSSLPAPGQK